MRFKYKVYGEALRPVIPVKISHKNAFTDCEVLVDSGADHCFFDAQVAEDIGIDTLTGTEVKEVFGLGGKVSLYYVHPITLTVGEKIFNIKAGFVPNLGGKIISYGIVGQKGFFDNFSVKFDLSKELIELKEIK